MKRSPPLPLVLLFTLPGCLTTVRAGAGIEAATGGRIDGRFPITAGFGLGGSHNTMVLVANVTPGIVAVRAGGGLEYNRNLRGDFQPFGLRARIEAGADLTYGVNGAAVYVGAVPGFWWMPAHTVYDAHRIVLAAEPMFGLRVPIGGSGPLGVYGGVQLVVGWDWVPCTMFGAGSCRPGPTPDGGTPAQAPTATR